jgi:predicted metalloendopeptidase
MIPAASFLWPFYSVDQKECLGWNYGSLGAIVGHEITHAFDELGKEYNEKGVQESWWTAHDMREYSKRTKALVALFSKQTIRGMHVNGASTLSENIADLGGLGIALDALRLSLRAKGFSEAQEKKELCNFFSSYAVSWRTKERPQRHLQNLILDKHAPVEFRVNLIVSQFDEWYEAFGVGPSHSLYIPPEDRIRIF